MFLNENCKFCRSQMEWSFLEWTDYNMEPVDNAVCCKWHHIEFGGYNRPAGDKTLAPVGIGHLGAGGWRHERSDIDRSIVTERVNRLTNCWVCSSVYTHGVFVSRLTLRRQRLGINHEPILAHWAPQEQPLIGTLVQYLLPQGLALSLPNYPVAGWNISMLIQDFTLHQ